MAVRKDRRKGWMVDFVLKYADGTTERVRRVAEVQNKRGAEAHERDLRQQMLDAWRRAQQGGSQEPKKEVPTFNSFADEFEDTYVRSNNKPSVQADKASILRVHLRPAFGRRRLDEIGVREVEQLKAQLLKRKLARKTVNNILTVLNRLLAHAIEVEALEDKPRIRLLKVPPAKFDFLDFDEYERLITVALETEPLWGSAILAAGDGGYRMGEVLGMYREDVDLVAAVITVRRSLWRDQLGSPKSGRERKVPMTARLADRLAAQRHLRGPFVWCDTAGEPLTKKMAQRAIERVCRRAGLRRIGWHVLRHTFCSHLAMRGAAPKAIQELAGHRDITTTMKYMHLAPSALHEAVALLDQGREADTTMHANGTYVAPAKTAVGN